MNPSDNKKKEVQLVDAVAKALGILDCFGTQETELSLNQLCSKTGLYKSRVHRLCGTLLATGYLVKTSRSNYRLGPKLMVLGKVYEQTNSLRSISAPFMKQLSVDTGQSSALFVIDGTKCICMAREMGFTRLVYAINEGEHMELAPTAAGKILLAYADNDFVDTVLEEADLVKFTPKTIVDEAEIRKELEAIRKNGYAYNIQGREEGVDALAAPIFDFEHKVQAAIAIVGPSHLFKGENNENMLKSLLDVTNEVSRLMGEF